MNKKQEAGNAHVIIIIAVIVVIIAALGFVFWQNFINKKASPAAKTSTSQKATVASKCLTASDFAKNDLAYIDTNSLHSTTITLDNFFFVADSTDFVYNEVSTDKLTTFARFYKDTSPKGYTFTIIGRTHESSSSSAGVTLANARAQKIKDALVTQGVPASRITIADPKTQISDIDDGSIDRSVDLNLIIPASCNTDK